MLERLTLRNFQCHRKLKLKFDPHVTTLLGSSDVGKSAVVRALYWLAFNKPSGNDFVTHGQLRAEVTLTVDGSCIRRTRGGPENSYEVNGTSYKAFGVELPTPVADLLRLIPYNFQGQHDSPFWFSDSAGAVSRSLNQIINLGAIDDTLAYLAQRSRQATARTAAAQERLTRAEEQWATVKDATVIDAALREVEEVAECVKLSESRTTLLRDLLGEASRWQEMVDRAGALRAGALSAVTAGEAWAALEGRRGELAAELARATELNSKAEGRLPSTDPLSLMFADLQDSQDNLIKLQCLIEHGERWTETKLFAAQRALETQTLFSQKLGATCPLCGRPTTASKS